ISIEPPAPKGEVEIVETQYFASHNLQFGDAKYCVSTDVLIYLGMYSIHQATLNDLETIRQIAEEPWWAAYSPILEKEQIRFMLDEIYSVEKISSQLKNNTQTY